MVDGWALLGVFRIGRITFRVQSSGPILLHVIDFLENLLDSLVSLHQNLVKLSQSQSILVKFSQF